MRVFKEIKSGQEYNALILPAVGNFGTDDKLSFTHANIANISVLRIKYSETTWIDAAEDTSMASTVTGLWQIVGTTLDLGYDGTNYFTGQITSVKGYNSLSELIFEVYISGRGQYEYDVKIPIYGTWSGTGTHIDYSSEGSMEFFDRGWSLFQKDGEIDEQVMMISGVAQEPAILSTYDNNKDHAAVVGKFNEAWHMKDYNAFGYVTSLLEIFNRDNLTIHSAAAQTGYYDSSHPFRWHSTEDSDPKKYVSFLNVGYRGKLYSKILSAIVNSTLQPVRHDETIVYNTDRTLDKEWSTFGYCKLKDYALIIDGTYVSDENNYVTLIP